MAYIKKYQRFVEELVMTDTQTKPGTGTETETPPVTTPARPLQIPVHRPGQDQQDAPLASTQTETKPGTETETPPVTTPARPLQIPVHRPGQDQQDAPLATADDVIDRFSRVYSQSSAEEQRKVDSYFKNYTY